MSTVESEFPAPWNRIFAIGCRVAVWALLGIVLYLLRGFFLLVFLTFIFAYIQANTVQLLSGRIRNRRICSAVVGCLLLGVLILVGVFLAPKVKEQSEIFAGRYKEHIRTVDEYILTAGAKYSVLQGLIPNYTVRSDTERSEWGIENSPTTNILQEFFGDPDKDTEPRIKQLFGMFKALGAEILAIGSAFMLSLLFSFLIVFDLPNLTASVRSLRKTRLKFVYEEVAPSVHSFCQVLGKALQAQVHIAIVNTILTGVLVLWLGLGEQLAFLLVIVFLCSFIPVVGVFISSAPICLLALQSSGLWAAGTAILGVLLIHFIEAYILNPKIYGDHLKLNPVIVLIILTLGGKLFNIWGLVLGVPVCTYVFGHAIHPPDEK